MCVLMIEQWQIYLNYHQRMGILLLKKRVNCDKCSFPPEQRMFGVFAIEEAPSPLPALYATMIECNLSQRGRNGLPLGLFDIPRRGPSASE